MNQILADALQAGEFAYQQEFHDLDHTDPNWATWYATYLLEQSEVSELLVPYFGIQQLSDLLHSLHGRYQHSYNDHKWPTLYSNEIAVLIKDQQ